MNGKARNEDLRKIFQDMPPSIPYMQRYEIIAKITCSNESSARSWISGDDKRHIPEIKLKAVKEAVSRYGNALQERVGQHAITP